MAKMKRELVLTEEEIDALTKADLVLEKIIDTLGFEEVSLGKDVRYPDILDEIYQDIENCFTE